MGQDLDCCGPSFEGQSQIEIKFNKFGLQHLLDEESNFENALEREIFMAINVFRYQPELFVPIIQRAMQDNPLAKQSKNTQTLLTMITGMSKIPEITYDVPAFDACRRNNKEQCAPNV
jgi:hypothetical protein